MPSSYALGNYWESFIKNKVDSGRYNSASEVVRDALRLLEEQDEWRENQIQMLRRQIQEGRESGPAISANQVFDRLLQKTTGVQSPHPEGS